MTMGADGKTRKYAEVTMYVCIDWIDGNAYGGSVWSTRVRQTDAGQSTCNDRHWTAADRLQQPAIVGQLRGQTVLAFVFRFSVWPNAAIDWLIELRFYVPLDTRHRLGHFGNVLANHLLSWYWRTQSNTTKAYSTGTSTSVGTDLYPHMPICVYTPRDLQSIGSRCR